MLKPPWAVHISIHRLCRWSMNAIGENAYKFFYEDMDVHCRTEIIKACKLLTPEQINTIGKYSLRFFPNIDKYDPRQGDPIISDAYYRQAFIKACSSLTIEQIEMVGECAEILLPSNTKEKGCKSTIKACSPLTPEEIKSKAYALQKNEFFLEGLDKCDYFLNNVAAGLSLLVEQIDAIGESLLKFFPKERRGNWFNEAIKVCNSLTPDQIKDRTKAISENKFFVDNLSTDSIQNYMSLTPEQIYAIGDKECALACFDTLDEHGRFVIVDICKPLTPELIKDRLHAIQNNETKFLSRRWGSYSFNKILREVVSLSAERITMIADILTLISSKDEPVEEIEEILKVCKPLELNERKARRKAIVDSKLITDKINVYDRQKIVQAYLSLTGASPCD